MWAFVDHGPAGTGEPLAALLRPGNAGSNTASDHLTVIRAALRQLPGHRVGHRPGRKILVRVDGAGATHELLDWLHTQRLSYSVGFGLTQQVVDQLAALPAGDWQSAYNADGEPRPGAWVIEATGLMSLTGWPAGMRVIVRKERPHPGAQLRLTDPDGHRYTAFATNTRPGGPHRQLADLELRHRRRARAEDRIRAAKDTGLTNLPLHELDQNRIWQAIVALACEITAWTQLLAFTEHPARRWEPKRLRLRIFSLPAQIARHARRVVLHLPTHAPWAGLALDGLDRLRAARRPGLNTAHPTRRPRNPTGPVEPAPPSDLGRTVTPHRQNALTTPASTGVDQASTVRRKIRARAARESVWGSRTPHLPLTSSD